MAAEGARAGEGGADRDFERDLLVHRPFGVDVGIARDDFEHLGGGRAGIGGGDAHAGLPYGAGNGFVAGKQKPAGGGGDCHLGHCSGHGALSGQREKIDLRPGVPCTQAIDKCELPNYPDLRGLRP
jgi:hypothetical protein